MKTRAKFIFVLILLILNIVIFHQLILFELKDPLKVVFLDVGQGDSIFIETKSGIQVLVDAGPNDSVLRELSKHMSFFDRSIDIIIATHPDTDHIGGLIDVFDRYDTRIYLESGNKSETLIYKSLEESLSKEDIKRITARKGMIFDLGDEILLKVLFPDRDVSRVEANTASIVIEIEHGDSSFLLTGDSPSSIEKYLALSHKSNLDTDVLKVGHHGSKTSSSEIFLGFANPSYAVISAGKNNRYGHPHEEVIGNLNKFEIEILETAIAGSIVFTSDGEEVRLK